MGTNNKPKLNFAQIWNMSMGFLGIQMGFALQNGNASRILSNFGADVHELSYFWLVAPITGLLVQPIIGHFGDHTWTKLGRRKPYFLAGAILACLGLIFLPNSSILAGEALKTTEFLGLSMILIIAILFLALMDASFNISMEPFRALVGDLLPKEQATLGFGIQTVIIGIGAVLGSFMPWVLTHWFGVLGEAAPGHVPPNVVYSFYIGAFILMATILYTIITTKEYPPEEFRKFSGDQEVEAEKPSIMDIFKDFAKMPIRMRRLGLVQFFSWFALFTMWVYMTTGVAQNAYEVEIDQQTYAFFLNKFEEKKSALNEESDPSEKQKFMEKYEKFTSIEPKDGMYYMVSSLSSYLSQGFLVSENELFEDVKNQLSTDTSEKGKELYVAMLNNEKYNNILVPFTTLNYVLSSEEKQKQENAMLLKMKEINSQNEAAGNWVGSLFGIYNFAAIPFAFLLIPFARRTSRKFVHILALLCGGLGLLSFLLIKSPDLMILPMIGIGFAWASILAMPYALLVDAIPLKKMGVYMGIFNFFIVIPQIINGLIGGSIVGGLFNDYAIYYVGLGGLSMIIAAILTFRIKEPLFGEEN